MDVSSAWIHLLNFFAPALTLAILVPAAARWMALKQAPAHSLWAQFAIHFVVNAALLLLCLWLLRRDGKMLAYGVMSLGAAATQWLLQRGWR